MLVTQLFVSLLFIGTSQVIVGTMRGDPRVLSHEHTRDVVVEFYKRSSVLLDNPRTIGRLPLAHRRESGASIGCEVDGRYYRLTQGFNSGMYPVIVRGLIAVEQVPDEAVVTEKGVKYANDSVGSPLWRLVPGYVAIGRRFGERDEVPGTIEDIRSGVIKNQDVVWSSEHERYIRDKSKNPELVNTQRIYGSREAEAIVIVGQILSELETAA